MDLEMKQHGAGARSDNPNRALGMGILVMRAHARQGL
jgi:hypothetical protein